MVSFRKFYLPKISRYTVSYRIVLLSYITSCVIFMKEEGYEEERLEAAGWTGVKVRMYVVAYSHVLYMCMIMLHI